MNVNGTYLLCFWSVNIHSSCVNYYNLIQRQTLIKPVEVNSDLINININKSMNDQIFISYAVLNCLVLEDKLLHFVQNFIISNLIANKVSPKAELK